MSKKKRRNKANQPSQEAFQAEAEQLSPTMPSTEVLGDGNAPSTEPPEAESNDKATMDNPVENSLTEDNPAEDASVEDNHAKTDEQSHAEVKTHHERFKFDWEKELEEYLIEALDEDADDLTDEAENAEPEPIQVKTVSLAQAVQAVFGLFVLVFSIIGVIATGVKIGETIKSQNDNSAQLAHFEDLVMPLVASDIPIFDSATSLNEDVIITTACWDIIFNPSAFYDSQNGIYKVPSADIDHRITKLFGTGLGYTHKTVGDTELTFKYDEKTGMYEVPAYPRALGYYPEVSAITETENGIELTVNYRLPITNWIGSLDTIEKTMIYTVVPTDTDYNITAVRIEKILGATGAL